MNIQELKVLAYDYLRQINFLQQQLVQIEQEILKLEKEDGSKPNDE